MTEPSIEQLRDAIANFVSAARSEPGTAAPATMPLRTVRASANFPERRNVRNHLTFGAGPHFCVGKQLALAELQTAFAIVLDRMKNLRLARGEDGIEWATRYNGYGVTRLEMAFDRN